MRDYYTEDQELFKAVAGFKAGDKESYYVIYDMSIKYIYKIVFDIIKDHHATEDLVQETYLTIYNKIGSLEEVDKFYAWAGRIATNHTFRYIQKNKRELLTLDSEDGSSEFAFEVATQDNEEFIPENILMDKEKQRLILQIIDGLSIEQKLAVQYFYYEEMSVTEIAEAMGCARGTIMSRLNYARKAIKAAVVEMAEKQGTKLYSLGALPLFYLLFRSSVENFTLSATAKIAGSIAAEKTAGVTVAGATAGTGAATGNAVSAGGTVSSGAVKGILGKLGAGLGAKIAAGVLAAGLLTIGGIVLYNAVTEEKAPNRSHKASLESVLNQETNAVLEDGYDDTQKELMEEVVAGPELDAKNKLIGEYYMGILEDFVVRGKDPFGNTLEDIGANFQASAASTKVTHYAINDINGDGLIELVVRHTHGDIIYSYNPDPEVLVGENRALTDDEKINLEFMDIDTVEVDSESEPELEPEPAEAEKTINSQYLQIIKDFHHYGKGPDGFDYSLHDGDTRDFAICDMDGDGVEELIVRFHSYLGIYGYDAQTMEVKKEFSWLGETIRVTAWEFYENGYGIIRNGDVFVEKINTVTGTGESLLTFYDNWGITWYQWHANDPISDEEYLAMYDADGNGCIYMQEIYNPNTDKCDRFYYDDADKEAKIAEVLADNKPLNIEFVGMYTVAN